MITPQRLLSIILTFLSVTVAQSNCQELDADWSLSVNGQSANADSSGHFRIQNVSGPDVFGAGGPGTAPDFRSDDFIRVTGTSIVGGVTQYAFSAPFQFRNGQSFTIPELTITSTPPPFPERLRITIDNPALSSIGQTTQLHVTGRLDDGTELDVTPRSKWTVYRTSNPAIATVGPDGLVTARGNGVVFLTAVNEGATAVTRAVVALGDPGTTVEGVVLAADETPVAGASVFIVGQGLSTTTDANGFFSVSGVLTTLGDISVRANATGLAASSPRIAPNPGGITDAGLLTLKPAESAGREFIVTFQPNFDLQLVASLFISSDTRTAGTVEIPGIGFIQDFDVVPGIVTTIGIPVAAVVTTNDGVQSLGIHITADDPINVYGLNQKQFTTDAFAALPVETFGSRYRVMSFNDLGSDSLRSQFAIVGEEENTTVTITPSAASRGHAAGVPYQVQLNRFDVYQLASDGGSDDFTGTLVESDKPVGVFSGHRCGNVPLGFGACDHLCEQIIPVQAWGQQALTVSLATRRNGDTFRILAEKNNTVVTISGNSPGTFVLNAGQFAQRNLQGTNVIESTEPILVAQFANGSAFDGVVSDPFMMLIPPSEQFLRSYTFATAGPVFPTNFVNVVAPSADAAAELVILDGAAIEAGAFEAIAGTSFSASRRPIGNGSHTVSGPNPLGIYVYGFANFDSYGYPGGLGAGTQRVTVQSTVANVQVADQTDTDQDGLPDSFETLHGLDLEQGADALLDSDGDGISNLDEYVAGTDPNDPTSRFRILDFDKSGSDMSIRFETTEGVIYRVECSADLKGDSWTIIHGNIQGTGAQMQVPVVEIPDSPRTFFRLVAVDRVWKP